jgi:hypothetical protein
LFIDFVLGPFSFEILFFDIKLYFIHVSVAKFEKREIKSLENEKVEKKNSRLTIFHEKNCF